MIAGPFPFNWANAVQFPPRMTGHPGTAELSVEPFPSLTRTVDWI